MNEIQPGMEVEDTGHELGEGDISKPRVSNVIRDKQGQVKYVIIGKGLLFKKMVLVPANRIKEVRREPENKKGPGEHKPGWLTNFFLALTALVLVASSVLFFYGLATGQGGS